jgi:SAM-dependent methyltransferase
MADAQRDSFDEHCQWQVNYGDSYLGWKGWGGGNFGSPIANSSSKAYFDVEMRRIKRDLTSQLDVLEIGFGNGSFLRYARNRGWNIVGSEVNKDLIVAAESQNFKVICTDNLRAFLDDSFDIVVAFDVLEHIDQEKLLDFVKEIKRVLKSSGIFLGRFPNGDSPFSLVNQNGDITHKSFIGSHKAKYLANELRADILYLGGEARPFFGESLLHFVHNVITIPLKAIINLTVKLIFFPRQSIAFCSANLVMILMFGADKCWSQVYPPVEGQDVAE